jgi:cell division GTPase FtsZ
MVREASRSDADVVLGVVQDRKMSRRVSVTVVATGLRGPADGRDGTSATPETETVAVVPPVAPPSTNGLAAAGSGAPTMF